MENALRCPKCAVAMSSFEHERVQLDLCPQCKGVWFDRGELASVLGAPAPKLGAPASLSLSDEDDAGHACPRCEMPLGERRFADDVSLLVDACPRCEGVFIERGELERIRRLARKPRHITREDRAAFGGRVDQQQMASIARARRLLREQTPAQSMFRSAEGAEFWWFFFLGLPLEDDARVFARAWGTWLLILANLAIWGWQLSIGLERSIDLYGMVPTEILRGERLYTLVSSEFVHGGWLHVLANMYFLFLFGDNVEERIGTIGFLLLYTLAGIGADALTLLESARLSIAHVGASGAIAGVMGAYLVFFPGARLATPLASVYSPIFWIFWKIWVISIPAWVWIALWMLANLSGAWTGTAGIAWWAHIGGFAVGFAVAGLWRGAGSSAPSISRAAGAR